MREVCVRMFAVAVAAIFWPGLPIRAAEAGATSGVVVLDTLSVWRMHGQLAAPVLETGEKAALELSMDVLRDAGSGSELGEARF